MVSTTDFRRTVTTQAELDRALTDGVGFIDIRSEPDVWLSVRDPGSAIIGGVVVDHTQEPSDPAAWCEWHDVPVTDGKAVLHKAVRDDWTTGSDYDYEPVYAPGAELEAPDWRDNNFCGRGLHFSPRTWEARRYHPKSTRFVAVEVDVADLRPLPGFAPKAKAPRCRVLYEVNIDGQPVPTVRSMEGRPDEEHNFNSGI